MRGRRRSGRIFVIVVVVVDGREKLLVRGGT